MCVCVSLEFDPTTKSFTRNNRATTVLHGWHSLRCQILTKLPISILNCSQDG